MPRPFRALILCAALAACVAAPGAAQDKAPPPRAVEETESAWKKLAPAGAGFTVLIPGTAAAQTSAVPTAAGELQNHIFTLETPLAAYIVSYVEFPKPVTDPDQIKFLLDRGRDGGLKGGESTLRSEKEIKIDGYSGRELVMAMQGKLVGHARLYWVGRRLYQTVIVMNDTPANASSAALKLRGDVVSKFLNSFALADERAGAR